MENHHVLGEHSVQMAIFHGNVKLPKGIYLQCTYISFIPLQCRYIFSRIHVIIEYLLIPIYAQVTHLMMRCFSKYNLAHSMMINIGYQREVQRQNQTPMMLIPAMHPAQPFPKIRNFVTAYVPCKIRISVTFADVLPIFRNVMIYYVPCISYSLFHDQILLFIAISPNPPKQINRII